MIVHKDKYSTLEKYWGFPNFRGNQEAIIDSILAGTDTLALMATGGGKSLCYQLPGMLLDGICVVISPLIALMEDQERGLREKGISAESVHSGKSKKRQDEIFDNCIYGGTKFLFISPEKFRSKLAVARISQMQVSFFAIDEAHCISQWGHDFRPSYLKLDLIKELFPQKGILALTATATENVVKDIKLYLNFTEKSNIFRSTFFRPNLSISVSRTNRKLQRIKDISQSVVGSKIIYARNKRHCEEINKMLLNIGIRTAVYHADIPIKARQDRQSRWISSELECMVCTSAFGMGIDKPDVRLVIHYDLPPSLEEYIQEIGRAGRDGKLSYTVLLYNNYDLQELEFHYTQSIPKISRIKEIYNELGTYLGVAIGDGMGQSFPLDTEVFIQRIGSNKVEVKSAVQTLEKNEYIAASSSFFTSDKIQIIAGKSTLNQLLEQQTDLALLVKYLLRNYEGLLYGYVSVSFKSIVRKYNWTNTHLSNIIALAEKQSILRYIHDDGAEKISYISERLPKANISIDRRALTDFYEAKKERYEAVVDYVLEQECRAIQLLAYFGEEKKEECGICDFCKGVFETSFSSKELESAKELIKTRLEKRPETIEELLTIWPLNKQGKLTSILQHLVDQDYLHVENNRLRLSNKR
jgi:ATP-dependent DNA helicase RecQ